MIIPNHTLTHTHLSPLLPTTTSPPFTQTHNSYSLKAQTHKPRPIKCSSSSVITASSSVIKESKEKGSLVKKPTPAEVSRTIMELSSLGTLCRLTQEGWPFGVGVRFAVDEQGVPVLCLNHGDNKGKCSLHVQSRSTQCTLQGNLDKPEDKTILKKLQSIWTKRFGEEVDEDLIYTVSVEKVLQIEDFMEDGVWVTSSDYKMASADPLREFAEKIVNDINTNHVQDFYRICDIYVELGFPVTDARLIWVDRLGFTVHVVSPQKKVYEVRIPFPREVADEKGVKSTFNCMSQLAWEVERNYSLPNFEKGELLKQIR